MGRPKKIIYEVSSESYAYAQGLIREYRENKDFCQQYERTHEKLIKKMQLEHVYEGSGAAIEDIKICAHIDDERERRRLEEYLDRKKKVFLVVHPIRNLMCDDRQMQVVAEKLFLEGATIQYINLTIDGKHISERTVAREKKRAIAYIAQYMDSYFAWEVESCFL